MNTTVDPDLMAILKRDHPDLSKWLGVDHPLTRDIVRGIAQYGRATAAQSAKLEELYLESRQPKDAEVPAPEGRFEIVGRVVSVKLKSSDKYPARLVMTVKIETEAGVWLTWGSVPRDLEGVAVMAKDQAAAGGPDEYRTVKPGDMVGFTASVERSPEDGHFSFFKRPSKARWVGAEELV